MTGLPDLSRFELQCLRRLWTLGEGTARAVQQALPDEPGYSTVRKILERLEEKGAIRRVSREGKAWIYAPAVGRRDMVHKEIRGLLDDLFDGSAAPLVSHLADMEALTVDDLKAVEERLAEGDPDD